MANLGRVAYVNRGAYNADALYEKYDVVYYNHCSYVYIYNISTINNLPTNETYWTIMLDAIGATEGIWGIIDYTGSTGIYISDTAPLNPPLNMLWEDTTENVSYVPTNRWINKKANFIGDSITQAVYGGGTVATPYRQWLKLLLGMTEARNYGESGTHISGNYIDDGNSGNPARSFATRFSVMDNDTDLVVVFGGTNDWGHARTAPFGTMADATDISFYGGLHVLISGLVRKYLGKTIIVMTPLKRDGYTGANVITGKTLEEYVDAIIEVAEYYGIHIVDLFRMGGMPTMISEFATVYINDGLHPNEAGHEFLGRRLAPIFAGL